MSTNARTLIRYIFPALGGLFVTYLYNVVDGIFVGQGAGSAALGAVNIAVPFITFVVAVTAMFPMGGATVVAIRMGRGGRLRAGAGADGADPSDAFSAREGQPAHPRVQPQRGACEKGVQTRRARGRHAAHHACHGAVL